MLVLKIIIIVLYISLVICFIAAIIQTANKNEKIEMLEREQEYNSFLIYQLQTEKLNISVKTAAEILANIDDKYLYLRQDGRFTLVSDCKWYKELCAKYGIEFINKTEDKTK